MRENIIINSNNFETLKNLALSLNEKVLILEKAFEKNEYIKHTDKIAKTFDEVRNEKNELNKFWNEKFLALETKTDADRSKLDADIKQKSFQSEAKLQQEQVKLNGLLEDNRSKIKELELKIETEKKSIKVKRVIFTCEECGHILDSKIDLKLHVKSNHPKHNIFRKMEL